MCIDCLKYQHSTCLGYKTTLGDYRCPQCWMKQSLLESEATLIVCPVYLQDQWCEEICKHVGTSLKVLVYRGSKAAPVYPTKLKDYDIVLTTYNVLKNELDGLSESEQDRTLQRESCYSASGSPLTVIQWWRLCLDEAQTVEVPGCMISTTAKKLHAHHRWVITSTPIYQDISSLYGLIDYLQLEPYNEIETWNHLLYLPYLSGNMEPMLKFLAQVMWCSSKSDVIVQLNIPNQTINEYVVEFSAVEKFYYNRQHKLCTNHFLEKLQGNSTSILLRTLDKSSFKKFMAPLLSIRQACTHPTTTRGRYLAIRKPVTSMEGLIDTFIEKNVNDSEEYLRDIVLALNGLAGIYLLLQNPVQAVEEYRKVLQLAARFNADSKEKIAVDKLQLIHATHNLADVLEKYPPVQPTLCDDTLRQDCISLQEKFMEKYINQNITAYKETRTATNLVSKLQEKSTLSPGQWYSALIDWAVCKNLMGDLYLHIHTLLDNVSNQKFNFSDDRQLLHLVATWDKDIIALRTTTIALLNEMYVYYYTAESVCKFAIAEGLVAAAVDCHLHPQKNTKKCLVCQVSVQMRQYEAALYNIIKNSEDISNKGSWKSASQELILKGLLSFAKAKNADKELVKDGELYFNILDVMKEELEQIRKFWTYLDQQICAHDESNRCKTRLHLNESTSIFFDNLLLEQISTALENKLNFINLIGKLPLDYEAHLLKKARRQNMAALERNLGTHSYLQTLRCQKYAGQSPDPCPICKDALQDQWSILPCGHCYCLECIQIILGKPIIAKRIRCPICRQLEKVEDISFIRTGEVASAQDSINIKGNYSTKVEAVTKLIMKLRSEDETVNILVFSTWVAVLEILQAALINNDIVTEVMLSHNLEQTLRKFKNKEITALLLPIRLGLKGLNLIEAIHVVLMEPLLNPGDELQAIGRVHLIGQTKRTTVHKFIVKNTIEESLHHATSSNADNWDKNKVTLEQFKNLFTETLEDDDDDDDHDHDDDDVEDYDDVDDYDDDYDDDDEDDYDYYDDDYEIDVPLEDFSVEDGSLTNDTFQ